MNKITFTILLTFLTLLIFKDCCSQETEILKECKIISINEVKLLPNYYAISAESEKGKIILLSSFEKSTAQTTEIKKNKTYDFEVEVLDSVHVNQQDSTYYFKFDNLRGGNGSLAYYVDGEKLMTFEDFNYKPFRPLNLKGLKYFEIEKKE